MHCCCRCRGPGGLHASLVAAKYGHEVTLVEKGKSIGGLLNVMRLAPMRREMADTMLDNYNRQILGGSVKLDLEHDISSEELIAMDADAVICAVGSRPYFPHVDG